MFFPYEVEGVEDCRQERPVTVYLLLTALVVVHLLVALKLDAEHQLALFYRFGAVKHDYHGFEWLTCTLLHADWTHALGNAYFLFIYGGSLERRLGWWRFLIVYLLGAAVSAEVQMWTMTGLAVDVPVIGASGAISGALGAFFVLLPRVRLNALFFSPISFRPFHVRVPAWLILALWFAGQMIASLQLIGEVTGVAFWAHVSGFVLGAGLGQLYQWLEARELHEWAHGRKRPLVAAWESFLAERLDLALGQERELRATPIAGAQGSQALLSGLVERRVTHNREAAIAHLEKAYRQAADYHDVARQWTCYLQLLQVASPFQIASTIHREAGQAAAAMKRPELAMVCYQYALIGGETAQLEALLTSLQAMLEHKFHRADLAREVAELREQ